ncbi:SpoIIE family protein phosphatase [Streptomyces viridiviolaceus]|uniref:SpoIIE family protein phosphatase n=1 Tax=Streptomyces viridiviolaceus TaxID=68282 RepID=A0ABW2E224_9ACTN|nr:SpoIIE family protein phosphatase [Streptomyces viridiviolaceus]
MCDAHRVTSEHATPAGSGTAPDPAALAEIVARQRAEMDRLRDLAATSAVVERAKGAVMALAGGSAEAAHETLTQRAKAARRTLLEECWITLGTLLPSLPASRDGSGSAGTAPPGVTGSGGRGPAVPPPTSGDVSSALARLARALLRIGSPQELARCLLDQLTPDIAADTVVIYARQPSGELVLTGHAGVDDGPATEWLRVPRPSGTAVLDALRDGEPQWPADVEPPGDRPGGRRSGAWLPVPPGDPTDVCLGVVRRHGEPFTADAREYLRAVARLCAGRLRAFDRSAEPVASGAAGAVQRVFDALPVPALLLTPLRAPSGEVRDFLIDAATAQAAEVFGGTGADPVGRRLLQWRPATAGEPLWQGCLRTLVTGEPYEGEPCGHQAAGAGPEPPAYSARVTALDGQLMLTWIRHDSSDRQQQRLADLQRLGNLGWANWNLLSHEANWSAQVYAIFGRDPARGPVRLTGLPGIALPDDAPALARAVRALVDEGRPCDVPFRTRTPAGVRHLRIVAEVAADAHGTPVEVHGFVQDLTARRRVELALVASERAMLTQHDVLLAEQTLAARLQHALLPLPERPVRPAGLRVEVAYLPAQSGLQVGGDWFSAIELPGGDALFVVGDVAGHGVDAVATMAQLRFTAKGMIITGSSLTGALVRLNTLLLHSRDSHGTASMVLARYDPGRRRLLWAQAGHLPPLLLRDGEARFLDRPGGMLLGASTTPAFEEAECLLEPGDRLILYTDGLVERPPENIDLGLERLAEYAAHHAGEPASLDLLLASMLVGDRRDDVCVLDIQVPDDRGRGTSGGPGQSTG